MQDKNNGPDPTAELAALRRENAGLKALVTSLTAAATASRDREMTWLYALEGNEDGVWDWNIVTGDVFFSPRWKSMLGFADDEITGSLSEWDSRVHPDDREQVYADIQRHLDGRATLYQNEHRVSCRDGSYKWILDRGKVVAWTDDGRPLRMVGTHTDITPRKQAELEREQLIAALRDATGRIKALSGLLPICACCKKIRDEEGHWNPLEDYIRERSAADFSHALCPVCTQHLYPGLLEPRGP